MVRVILLERPVTLQELRADFNYDFVNSEIVLGERFKSDSGVTVGRSNQLNNAANIVPPYTPGASRPYFKADEWRIGINPGSTAFVRINPNNNNLYPRFASAIANLVTVNVSSNQKWNANLKVENFVDFTGGIGEFGGTAPVWKVPVDQFTYEWSSNGFATPEVGGTINTIVSGALIPLELFNPDSTANNAQFRIRRAAIESTNIKAGASSGLFRIPKVRNRTAYPSVNLNTMTFQAKVSQEYLIVGFEEGFVFPAAGSETATLQAQIQSGIISGTMPAGVVVIQNWTRVTRTAVPINPEWTGKFIYLREAATLAKPYSLMSSPTSGTGDKQSLRSGLAGLADFTTDGPFGQTDVTGSLGSLFTYNVNAGTLAISKNIPDEFRIMGYTSASRINVSSNSIFFIQATNKLDLRPYMVFENGKYYIWVQIQGNVKNTKTTTAMRLEIDLVRGGVVYAPPTM
jgi:hypothetical protein